MADEIKEEQVSSGNTSVGGTGTSTENQDAGKGQEPKAGGTESGKTYDEAYVKSLRDEAAGNRVKIRELEAKIKAYTDKDKTELQRAADALKAVETERDTLKQSLRQHELALAAVKFNAIHPEVVAKMVPEDSPNIEVAIADLKKQYPSLFRTVGSGDGGAGTGSGNAETSMNTVLRRAAGFRD